MAWQRKAVQCLVGQHVEQGARDKNILFQVMPPVTLPFQQESISKRAFEIKITFVISKFQLTEKRTWISLSFVISERFAMEVV